ncbi:MAG: FAD/NAD(P)-binding oxidoreductase [Bacillota bacterium]
MGTVAIIGGGAGGAAAARLLRRQLGSEHRVVLIEQEPAVLRQEALPRLAVGLRSRQDLVRNINRLAQEGLQVVVDRVLRVDCTNRRIYTENRAVQYDLVIIAAGAGLKPGHPPGTAEAGYNVLTAGGAAGILARIKNFQGEEVAILASPSPLTKYPAAPYEYALLLENWFRMQGRGKDLSITIITPEPVPLQRYGSRAAEAVAELLLKRNIRVHPNTTVQQVDLEKKLIQPAHGGSFLFDLLLYCPESAPPPLLRESGLADETGWLPVDRHTLLAKQEGVLGLGDATRITTHDGAVLPQMGAAARGQARVAAGNAARLLNGKAPEPAYRGKAAWFLDAGRGALLFTGGFYQAPADFRPHPAGALLHPLQALWQ